MRPFRISRLSEPDNSAWRLYRSRASIQIDPEYQRSSDIWNEEKKQLLIDTVLNGFDVPKLYFHKYASPIRIEGKTAEFEYAILDGKQRLEAIWDYIEGKFALSADFECLWDPTLNAAGQTYAELGKNFPDLRNALDSYGLTVVCIETEDVEIIEDMFSRLNEAVPLSAAEKRNAKGGPVPPAIKALASQSFFLRKLPFGNGRYRHFDLAVKFLMSAERGRVVDTKKGTLDRYVVAWAKEAPRDFTLPALKESIGILEEMTRVFIDKDKLLRQVGAVILYYQLFRLALTQGWVMEIQRTQLEAFEAARLENRTLAELGEVAQLEFMEFDRYAQSTNDPYAVRIRLSILLRRVFGRDVPVEEL